VYLEFEFLDLALDQFPDRHLLPLILNDLPLGYGIRGMGFSEWVFHPLLMGLNHVLR
jgi:hypothetical protein